jgi:hypothetical protein
MNRLSPQSPPKCSLVGFGEEFCSENNSTPSLINIVSTGSFVTANEMKALLPCTGGAITGLLT